MYMCVKLYFGDLNLGSCPPLYPTKLYICGVTIMLRVHSGKLKVVLN